ncbi:hypothetical protein ACU635_19420 [[Actinomadura] parvosata]|uniref:hypothetical protein n=1 Tax=[Actinomadura] parvosata TaxID=1955412 RepID=UPI00406C40B9
MAPHQADRYRAGLRALLLQWRLRLRLRWHDENDKRRAQLIEAVAEWQAKVLAERGDHRFWSHVEAGLVVQRIDTHGKREARAPVVRRSTRAHFRPPRRKAACRKP